MKKAILATKVGMTQIFNADGVLVPVTVLQAGRQIPETACDGGTSFGRMVFRHELCRHAMLR